MICLSSDKFYFVGLSTSPHGMIFQLIRKIGINIFLQIQDTSSYSYVKHEDGW